jgi:hypothetical protein
MKAPVQAITTAAMLAITLIFSAPADAGDKQRLKDILHAQALYEQVLRTKVDLGLPLTAEARRGATGYETAGPYTAPLPGTTGPSFLWGGIDVIEVLKTYDDKIGTDPGRVIFIDRDGDELGNTVDDDLVVPNVPVAVRVPAYVGQPQAAWPTALFQSQANANEFLRLTRSGALVIAFGLNCQWGIIAGPQSAATGGKGSSHWAQPGLAAINVERLFDGRVTVLGMNLYLRGDDWNATKHRWKHAIDAFEQLLANPLAWRANRERHEMPIIRVNE